MVFVIFGSPWKLLLERARKKQKGKRHRRGTPLSAGDIWCARLQGPALWFKIEATLATVIARPKLS
jgi:hypothetical protein